MPRAQTLAERVFARALAAFEAAQGSSPVERRFALDGLTVCLRFTGDADLSALGAAVAHKPASEGEPDLTICAWSDRATVEHPDSRQLAGAAPQRESAAVIYAGWGDPRGALSLIDRECSLALYCGANPDAVRFDERGAPFLAIFHRWLRRRGRQVVHAGALGTEAGGVLLAGKGGVGKSTSALSCLGTRLRFAADDYCAVSSTGEPAVHSLFSSAKVRNGQFDWFPHLRGCALRSPEEEKTVFLLHPQHSADLIDAFPLRAILLPRVSTQEDTTLQPASAAEVLRALAPSTIFQLPAADERDLRFLADLSRRLPGYVLELGRDRGAIEPAIVALLDR